MPHRYFIYHINPSWYMPTRLVVAPATVWTYKGSLCNKTYIFLGLYPNSCPFYLNCTDMSVFPYANCWINKYAVIPSWRQNSCCLATRALFTHKPVRKTDTVLFWWMVGILAAGHEVHAADFVWDLSFVSVSRRHTKDKFNAKLTLCLPILLCRGGFIVLSLPINP